jgi:hypothetical protein
MPASSIPVPTTSRSLSAFRRSCFRAYNFLYGISRRHWQFDFSDDRSYESAESARYSSVSILQTRKAIRALGDVKELGFCDVGCGKGRVLFVAAGHPFRRILGIELFPSLAAVGEQNLARRRSVSENRPIEIVCADATEFAYPAEPMVYYFFNPFPAAIFARVVARLESCRGNHRTLLILVHPVSDAYTSILRACPYRLIRTLDHSFSRSLIYEHT